MSTLHRIRDFALVAALGVGALVGSAALACEDQAGGRSSIALLVDLGQMTVVAQRDEAVANLGSMTVTAPRLADVDGQFADLGALTVTASRVADTHVADLGAMTVTASRIETIRVAARAPNRTRN